MVLIVILLIILIPAAISDILFHRIPNRLTFAAILGGIVFHAASGGLKGVLLSLEGLFLGLAVLILFYILGGMGGGDVKLMGAVGAILGPKGVFAAFLASALVGGVYAGILLASRRQLGGALKRHWLILKTVLLSRKVFYLPPSEGEKGVRLTYGVAIALGTILSVAMKNQIYALFYLN
jgi:prepilin peptidase CpaA